MTREEKVWMSSRTTLNVLLCKQHERHARMRVIICQNRCNRTNEWMYGWTVGRTDIQVFLSFHCLSNKRSVRENCAIYVEQQPVEMIICIFFPLFPFIYELTNFRNSTKRSSNFILIRRPSFLPLGLCVALRTEMRNLHFFLVDNDMPSFR